MATALPRMSPSRTPAPGIRSSNLGGSSLDMRMEDARLRQPPALLRPGPPLARPAPPSMGMGEHLQSSRSAPSGPPLARPAPPSMGMGEHLQSSRSVPSLAQDRRASSNTLKSGHPCSIERPTSRDVSNQSIKKIYNDKAISVSCANLEGMLKRVDPSWTLDEFCFHMSIILDEWDRLLKHVSPGKENVNVHEFLDDTRHNVRVMSDCHKIKAQMMSYEKQNQMLREKNEKLDAEVKRLHDVALKSQAKDKEARHHLVQARTQALWSLDASISGGERLRKALTQSQASDKEARELLREARELLVQAQDQADATRGAHAKNVAHLAARAEASDSEAERRQEALERLLEQDRAQLAQTTGEAMLTRREALEQLIETDRTQLLTRREALEQLLETDRTQLAREEMPPPPPPPPPHSRAKSFTNKVAKLEEQLAPEFSPEEAFAAELLQGEPKQSSLGPSTGL